MVEIFIVIQLCIKNHKGAVIKGREPAWVYVLITLALWFGLEVVGGIIGFIIFKSLLAAYIVGFASAIGGGVISMHLSR